MSRSNAAFVLVLASLLAITACASKPQPRSTPTEPLAEQPPPADAEPAAPTEDAPPTFRCDGSSADWPMFQRSKERDGVSPYEPLDDPTAAWSEKIGIAGWLNNPVIADGTVFAPSSGLIWNRPDGSDGLFALSLEDGSLQWFHATDDDATAAAYAGCRVFVGSDAGTVTALDARTGERLWEREYDGKMYANPLPLDDVLIVAGATGVVEALDMTDGTTVWSTKVGGTVRGGAASDGARVYVATESKRVFALEPASGERIWSAEIADPHAREVYAVPTVHDDVVVVGYARDTSYSVPALQAFDAKTGAVRWSGNNDEQFDGGWGNVRSSPAVYDERLFWGEPYSNRVVAASTTDGEIVQSMPAGFCMFPHWPSPAVARGVVYVGRHDGGLTAIDPNSGVARWRRYVGHQKAVSSEFPPEFREVDGRCAWEPPFGKPIYASPAIAADGSVVVATGDGWIHRFVEREVEAVGQD